MSEQLAETTDASGGWVGKLLAAILILWNTIPEKQKERIFEKIVDGFEELIRFFYRKYARTEQATAGEAE